MLVIMEQYHCQALSNNSLLNMQYGFKPGCSCEHALLNSQNKLLESLNNRQISIFLLIVLSTFIEFQQS